MPDLANLVSVGGVTTKKTAAFLGALLALAIPSAWAQEAAPSREMAEKFYRVPPGFLPNPNPANAGNLPPKTGQSFLEESGVAFPPGAFAQYFRSANLLVVRNSSENLDLVDFLIGGCGPCSVTNPAVEIIAWDCPIPPGPNKILTPSEVRQTAKARILSQISVIGRSGFLSSARKIEKATSAEGVVSEEKEGTEFLSGEFGAKVSVEPIVGPDGATIDLAYRYRLRLEQPGGTWSELDLAGDITLRDGVERILYVCPFGEGRQLAVIAQIRLKDYHGVSVARHTGPNSP